MVPGSHTANEPMVIQAAGLVAAPRARQALNTKAATPAPRRARTTIIAGQPRR